MRLYLRECTGGTAVHVVPGVIHDDVVVLYWRKLNVLDVGVAVMVERVERPAVCLQSLSLYNIRCRRLCLQEIYIYGRISRRYARDEI